MKKDFQYLIYSLIKISGKKPLPYKRLLKACKVNDGEFKLFTTVLENMKKKGTIVETSDGFLLPEHLKKLTKTAIISRLNATYGFAKDKNTDEEYFISGKFLLGALPGDEVLITTFKGKGYALEGKVEKIVKENFSHFTGTIVLHEGRLMVLPDLISNCPINFRVLNDLDFSIGDKVSGEITKRGLRHSEHLATITSNFGSSEKAKVCCEAILMRNGITREFPYEVLDEARFVSNEKIIIDSTRLDLRDKVIFTIDGKNTKDIDDAISVEKIDGGYILGVHIADVSHYVKPKSLLDNEAFRRGTSIYFADSVIPMLPKELSNGICSLNPNEDRYAFSSLIRFDDQGFMVDYEFKKTVIRSRIKGVYSEINEILDGTKDDTLLEKYAEVKNTLSNIVELWKLIHKNKLERHVPELDSVESAVILDESGKCIGVIPRTREISEVIIEDFMLSANEAAAKFSMDIGLPFVYRVHENPPEDKIESLQETLLLLNIPTPDIRDHKVSPFQISEILNASVGTGKELIVNNIVLRSMAKAKYSTDPIGHFGLALDDYTHFTSPIRRYSDLAIHRIMSEYLCSHDKGNVSRLYQKFAHAAAKQATETELLAIKTERECDDCYKAEYMKTHVGESFKGVISSVTEFGIFVILENSCEGLIRIEDLGFGEYVFDGGIKLKNLSSGTDYTVGDEIKIKVSNANVSVGKVDFILD